MRLSALRFAITERMARLHVRISKDGISKSGDAVLLYEGREPTKSELSTRIYSEGGADLIVVDESNSFSSRSDGKRRNLTIVCTRVRDRKRYADIQKLMSNKKRIRQKYSNTYEPELSRIVEAISEQDIVIVERHSRIDFDSMSDTASKRHLYMRLLTASLTDAIMVDPGRQVDIIIDTPPIQSGVEMIELARSLQRDGRKVRWFEIRRSASDRYLTVHDFETGVVSDMVEGIPKGTVIFNEYIRKRFRGTIRE